MRHGRLLWLAVVAAAMVGCEQEGAVDGDADGGGNNGPDYALPPPGQMDMAPPVVVPPPPDPCTDSRAIDFIAEATPMVDGALAYEGQLQEDAGFIGSCGGAGPEAWDETVRFVAPEAGTWQFLLTPRALRGQVFNRYDPVLHARSTCDDPESELACNDDIASGRLESQLRLVLEQGEEVFLIVDTIGRAINARYELTARRIPIVEVGEACDVASAENGCAPGSYCRSDPQVRGPEGICAPDDAPVITNVLAYATGANLGLVVEGTDAGADVDRAFLNLLDADGNVLVLNDAGADTYILTPIQPTFGQTEVTFLFQSNLLTNNTASIRVRLLDARDNESEPVDAVPARPAPLIAGDVCDGTRIRNSCSQGTACLDADGDGEFNCVEPTAPRLTRAKGFYDGGALLTGFQVSGVDPDRDVTGVFVELVDAEGDLVASGDLLLDFVQYGGEDFTGLVSIALNRDDGAIEARLTPFDAEGLRGEAFDVGLLDPPRTVGEGEVCDPLEAQARCEGDAFCFQADPDSLPVCGAPLTTCPAEWGEPVDLNAWPDGDVWRYGGDLTTRFNLTEGSCGGGSAQTILAFDPPETGRYTVVTYSTAGGSDTVLYARSHCGFDPSRAAVELACNDDISIENAFSLLSLDLVAGEPIYIFVDGSTGNGAWRGPYTVTVRRQF